MRDHRCFAKCHRFAIVQDFVDGVLLAARLDRLERGYILCQRHHLSPSHFLYHRITFLMIAVRMIPQQDFNIGEIETQSLNRLLDDRNVPCVTRAIARHPCGRTMDSDDSRRCA